MHNLIDISDIYDLATYKLNYSINGCTKEENEILNLFKTVAYKTNHKLKKYTELELFIFL